MIKENSCKFVLQSKIVYLITNLLSYILLVIFQSKRIRTDLFRSKLFEAFHRKVFFSSSIFFSSYYYQNDILMFRLKFYNPGICWVLKRLRCFNRFFVEIWTLLVFFIKLHMWKATWNIIYTMWIVWKPPENPIFLVSPKYFLFFLSSLQTFLWENLRNISFSVTFNGSLRK